MIFELLDALEKHGIKKVAVKCMDNSIAACRKYENSRSTYNGIPMADNYIWADADAHALESAVAECGLHYFNLAIALDSIQQRIGCGIGLCEHEKVEKGVYKLDADGFWLKVVPNA